MAKKQAEKDDNFKKYQTRLSEYKPEDLVPPTKALTIDDLAAEGAKLLGDTKIAPTATPVVEAKKLKITTDNPYVQARLTVLKKYPQWKQVELTKMEECGNLNNRHYEQFVKEVIELGNHLSEKQK